MTRIDLPWNAPPLTKNDTRRQGNHHAMRRKWTAALQEARWAIRSRRNFTDLTGRAKVVLHWRQPDHRHRDGDGAALTLSVCLDALVQEGLLVDDDWQHVGFTAISTYPPQKGLAGALWLTIEDMS